MSDLLPQLQTVLADRYTIERELGRGGMATVYLAQDLKHHRPVALKVLHPQVAAVLGSDRFLREIDTAATLNHPHILPLFDSGAAGQRGSGEELLWYAMPFIDGESLRDLLNRERQLSMERALSITRDVAGALAHAHAHGVVHRDIKPENILLAGEHALVADFGIARAIGAAGGERLTETGLAIGTAAYMSPEQASAERDLDGRSDIYALGCVLYEMLAGQPPFSGPTAQSVLARHAIDPVPSLRTVRQEIPAAVEHAVKRALAKNPADRFQTAAKYAAALRDSTTHTTLPVPVPVTPLRRPFGWWIGGAAVVIVIAGALLLSRRNATPPPIAGGSQPEATPTSDMGVAVLGFENLSRDTADLYLAEGLADETISRLGQVSRLTIKSRAAVRRLPDTALDPLRAGQALNVAHIVTGTIRRRETRLHVTVELVRVADGDILWSSSYDRTGGDLLAIEEDIARAVATAIAGRLLPDEQALLARIPTTNREAYDHFLRGNYYIAQRAPRLAVRAIDEYLAAVQLDPGFTRAHARLAYGYWLLLNLNWEYNDLPSDSLLARGLDAVDLALRQDSGSPDSWMVRGSLLAIRHPRTFEGVRAAFERAVALDPENAEAHHLYAVQLRYLGDDSTATAEYHRALGIEPDRAISLQGLGSLRFPTRQYAEARLWFDSALVVDPGYYLAYLRRARVRLQLGEMEEARSDAETARRLGVGDELAEAVLVLAEVRMGDTLTARARLEQALRDMPRLERPGPTEALFGAAMVAIGDREQALDFLERVQPRGYQLVFELRAPEFDDIRSHPRFQRLLEGSKP
jgi:serine/threonine protein kinase/tetratricopeptide (TPR) repeat protein